MTPTGQADEFIWCDDFLLGYQPMDETHEEFVTLVHAMQAASDADFLPIYDSFIEHAVRHFDQEKDWMSLEGYPAKDCHVHEHDQVMNSLVGCRPKIVAGDMELGRALVAELERWFPGHADYMDSALAKWMVKRNTGGSPVVIKRSPPRRRVPGAEQAEQAKQI
ncbi:MAG: hemerythrin domain-containing protein [Proteobacteria bacterium]|nr:hemerythrin domain-containing protein [Pseudomonadota bacterium]HQR02693.1 hemerythrin domain-containing protein [Rhodocyclaceae bacterium]